MYSTLAQELDVFNPGTGTGCIQHWHYRTGCIQHWHYRTGCIQHWHYRTGCIQPWHRDWMYSTLIPGLGVFNPDTLNGCIQSWYRDWRSSTLAQSPGFHVHQASLLVQWYHRPTGQNTTSCLDSPHSRCFLPHWPHPFPAKHFPPVTFHKMTLPLFMQPKTCWSPPLWQWAHNG